MLRDHGSSQDAISPGDAPRLPGDGCRRRSVRFMNKCIKKWDETRFSFIDCSCIKCVLLFAHQLIILWSGDSSESRLCLFFSAIESPQNLHCKNQLLPDFVLILLTFFNIPKLQSSLPTTSAAPGAITITEPLMETSTTSLPLATTSWPDTVWKATRTLAFRFSGWRWTGCPPSRRPSCVWTECLWNYPTGSSASTKKCELSKSFFII